MGSGLKAVNAAIQAHIIGSEVTQEDWDQYLGVVAEAEAMIKSKFGLKWPEFQEALSEYMDTGKNYYLMFDSLLALATYKKLVPEEKDRDMRSMYFAMWFSDMVNVVAFIIDDIIDKDDKRAGAPAVHVKLGAPITTCLSFCVMASLMEIIDDVFEGKKCAREVRQIVRDHLNSDFYSIMVDTTPRSEKHAKARLCWEYQDLRTEHAFCLPGWVRVRAAFAVAGVSIEDSKEGQWCWKAVQITGSVGRAIDDVEDTEQEVGRRAVSWPSLMAMQVDPQLIEDHFVKLKKGTTEKVVNLCNQIDVWNLVRGFELEHRKQFRTLLEEAPEDIPKPAWIAFYDFCTKYYVAFYQGGEQEPQLL